MNESEESQKPGERRKRKVAFGSIAAGVFAIATTVLAVMQITQDVETIAQVSESPTEVAVIDTKSEKSLFEVLGQGYECFLGGVGFLDNGSVSQITEAKWRAEDRTLDVRFDYTCLSDGKTFNLTVTNLIQTAPGSLEISANSSEVKGGELSLGITIQNWEGSYCESKSVPISGVVDGGFTYFEKRIEDFYSASDRCDLISPYSPIYLESSLTFDTELSSRIDELAVSKTPEGCHFIAAILEATYELPEEEDKAAFDFLNANYPSYMLWEISSPNPNDYTFDESLATKLAYQPEWVYYCQDDGLSFSEIYLGGFIFDEDRQTYRRPADNEFNVVFNPWLEEPYDAEIKFEFYNTSLELCDSVTGTMMPKTEFDSYYRYSETIALDNFDVGECPIMLLTEFNGIPGGVQP